jgi:hypothetical protein
MNPLLPLALVAALAAPAALAQEQHVGRNAELGDPARWYQPDDTPEKRYRTAMKEAVAAKAEAVKECRASVQAKACEAEARRQYESEAQRARELLVRPSKGSTP